MHRYKMKPFKNFPQTVIPGDLICPIFDVDDDNKQEVVIRFLTGTGCKQENFRVNGKNVDIIVATLKGSVSVEEVPADIIEDDDQEDSENTTFVESHETTGGDASSGNSRVIKSFKVSVSNPSKFASKYVDDQFVNNLPQEGDIVLARVTRISLQRITVEILAVENSPLPIDSGVGSNGTGIIAAAGGSGASTFSVSQVSADLGETFRGIIRSQDVRATDRDRVKVMESFKPGDIIRAQVLSLGDGTHYYLTTARNDLGVVFAKSSNGAGEQMYAIDWQTMISPKTGVAEKRKCAKPF
ncbi:exosome non-catalytic core subunit CSL4 [Kluyveromyces lactis]|uniref:KLLA0D19701p n=1 Tax=Kluyveromyces lactis (strain ATCC 8585 / CBS 2359 / DSM 70799 / NBRC 1267 / NRRL Y-1140 / WM37) TaxID=284590 RepID=Q6CQ52_KLULA|nr:uncharacterized protein KLLA0_D19701g [Kluyveromyces lactis]CAH01033.1 KLLA0D19701p [Kluyveromyces lactis]|eukprot:XP_453937.1 uncharacterized protein KLLA0_D19701g [Kluyveromyces lactis]